MIRAIATSLFCVCAVSISANADTSFVSQANTETNSAKEACEKFKVSFAPLEAKERVKGRDVLNSATDVAKAIALIDAKGVSTAKQIDLRNMFFGISKPTKADIEAYVTMEVSNCFFPVFKALARTIETAGRTSDVKLKDEARGVLKRWFAANDKNGESLISTATSRILFDRAADLGVLKAGEKDVIFLKELRKEISAAVEESKRQLKSVGVNGETSNIDEKMPAEKKKSIEDYDFDPVKMQKYFADERDAAKKLTARLKVWLDAH